MADELIPHTPLEYLTPEQAKAFRLMGQSYLKQAEESPVRHWSQGVANMARALAGGYTMYQANERENKSRTGEAWKAATGAEEGRYGKNVTIPSSSIVPPQKVADATPYAPAPIAQALMKDGDQPVATVPGMTFGRMHAPGTTAVTPEEAAVLAKSDPRFAYEEPTKRGVRSISTATPTEVAATLAKGAGAPTGAAPAPSVEGGPPPVSFFNTRPTVSKNALFESLRSTHLPKEWNLGVMERYLGQDAPVTVDTGTGTWSRTRSGDYLFTPKQDKDTIHGRGGTQVPLLRQGTPQGGWKYVEPEEPAKSSAPVKKPVDDGPPTDITPTIPTNPKRGASVGAPTVAAADPFAKPMASPEISAAKALPGDVPPEAAPPITRGGMLDTKPPVVGPEEALSAPVVEEGGIKTAQIPRYADRVLEDLDQRGLRYERQEEYQKKDVEAHRKLTDETTQRGRLARTYLPELEMASNLINNPNFISGSFQPLRDQVQRFKGTFGFDPTAAAPNEIFDKIMSRSILNDLKLSLGGLGQVRVAEIDLLKQATANRSMTKEGMAHVIDLMVRLHKDAERIGTITNKYEQGYRLMDDGKTWIKGRDGKAAKTGEAPTMAGLQDTLENYAKANPIMTSEDMAKALTGLTPKETKKEGTSPKYGPRPVPQKTYGKGVTPPPGYE